VIDFWPDFQRTIQGLAAENNALLALLAGVIIDGIERFGFNPAPRSAYRPTGKHSVVCTADYVRGSAVGRGRTREWRWQVTDFLYIVKCEPGPVRSVYGTSR
jgi:hypothetical protein